jgi:thiol-disulfide isomerase/thioredoxin
VQTRPVGDKGTPMKRLVAAVAVIGLSTLTARADEPKPPRDGTEPAPSLKVGDPAPALKVGKLLQGDAVTKFEPGKVYVVHFWAIWCAPCIGKMPHLADLQARYKDQGVTVIGFTSRDIRGNPGNTEEDVAAFLKKRGAALRFNFTMAYAGDNTTADAWLKAAGQGGWCTFVVDKAGRIAYAGSSMFLDVALPKVLAGASPKAVGDEMAKVVAEYETTFDALVRDFQAGRDLKPGLGALKEFEAKYPPLTDMLPIVQAKLSLLPKYGKPGEAKEYAEATVAKGIEREDVQLLTLAYSILRNEKQNKESLALAVKAAEACVRIDGGKDPEHLIHLADAYHVHGHTAKAKEYARRTVEAAAGESAAFREAIEKEAERLGAGK